MNHGKVKNADLPFSSKHPLLWTKGTTSAFLTISNAHQWVQHNGVQKTLTEVRSNYWNIGERSLVKSFIQSTPYADILKESYNVQRNSHFIGV